MVERREVDEPRIQILDLTADLFNPLKRRLQGTRRIVLTCPKLNGAVAGTRHSAEEGYALLNPVDLG